MNVAGEVVVKCAAGLVNVLKRNALPLDRRYERHVPASVPDGKGPGEQEAHTHADEGSHRDERRRTEVEAAWPSQALRSGERESACEPDGPRGHDGPIERHDERERQDAQQVDGEDHRDVEGQLPGLWLFRAPSQERQSEREEIEGDRRRDHESVSPAPIIERSSAHGLCPSYHPAFRMSATISREATSDRAAGAEPAGPAPLRARDGSPLARRRSTPARAS